MLTNVREGIDMKNFRITSKGIIVAITYVLIVVSGIISKQNPILMIPLFVSMFIMALQASIFQLACKVTKIEPRAIRQEDFAMTLRRIRQKK